MIRFSFLEIRHLALAVLALTAAFALLLTPGYVFDDPGGYFANTVADPLLPLSAFLAVLGGFVLHELAHKVVAQAYGHWAEFRAQFAGLGLSVVVVLAAKVLFAAPGAVIISGRVTPRENALISLAGPGVNLVIAASTLPFARAVDASADLPAMMATVGLVNAILAVFNMLPISVLDGRKVMRWNKAVGIAALLVTLALAAYAIFLVDPMHIWEERIG